MTLAISGWGLAVPRGFFEQSVAAQHAVDTWGAAAGLATTIPALYRRSGVKKRHCVIVDEGDETGPATQSFYPVAVADEDRGPTTQDRMEHYQRSALPLATRAARAALEDAGLIGSDITHLVTVSCSGFEAPGVDVGLFHELGLDPQIPRTHVGFMGCHGAFNALRVARAFTGSDPAAKVLVCCVEICSIHQQYSADAQLVVANALFSDGAAAVVATAAATAPAQWQLADQRSLIVAGTADLMSWRIKDHGYEMTLSPQVPQVIQSRLAGWLETWLAEHSLKIADVQSWAVHPGGPRILTACVESLGLPAAALDASRGILAEFGNMSSPTVLFILNRLREAGAATPCVSLAFGPGLTIEAALWSSTPGHKRPHIAT